ncbi:YqgE/AlgH family protein, partial [Actibacterium sp.]|uniref:YqgE/AlgH family protein n=1 Tax=Actibacterium sp. TaxID=1872125 RepID=UPI003563F3DB
MSQTLSQMDLSGKLLIAMPGMGDPRFEHSVVYMCAHSADGAMGLIINKIAPQLSFGELLEQLDITPPAGDRDIRVHFGGPVEHGRGFVLHSADYFSPRASTMEIDNRFGLTATLDILQDLARGAG